MMWSNGLLKMARGAALVTCWLGLAAGAASAAERFVPAVDNASPVAGGSVTLWWLDESLPDGGLSSYTSGDVWVAYDASVLSLTAFAPGTIFNGATATLNSAPNLAAQYPWLAAYGLTLAPYIIDGGVAQGAATSQDVAMVSFSINPLAATGTTDVYFLPDQIAVQGGFGALPGYYAFGSNVGYGAALSITAIPEPASLALMLAGLGVVAGVAIRRRGAAATAG